MHLRSINWIWKKTDQEKRARERDGRNTEEIIGQSGHLLNAGCILVLGASGAGAFSVGIEKAGKIIAVNTNKNALIFKKSDYGLRIDAEAVIDELLKNMD